MSFLDRFRPSRDDSIPWPAIAAGSGLFIAGVVVRGLLSGKKQGAIVQSPLSTILPKLSNQEIAKLPYPPDALPGARDVASPYGSVRAYEWGPEEGRKVLMLHGISTPCLSLGAVAHGLVEKGCRVMLFDLFGRGYSDNPADIPHDTRLFTSQMLLVLASSPLSWIGEASGGFSLVGYSLGGGICTVFTSYFPHLVSSLVLISPSGLLRPHHITWKSKVIYSEGTMPESLLNALVKRRLKTPLYPNKPKAGEEEKQNPVAAEMPALESNEMIPLSKSHPDITIETAVGWQVDNHDGFIPAFMSSIRHGPITEQHEHWRRIGGRLTAQNLTTDIYLQKDGLENGKVLIVSGETDAIIIKDELTADATAALEGNVEFKWIKAGHGAPVEKSREVVKAITSFWKM